jgi:hypothetical protein
MFCFNGLAVVVRSPAESSFCFFFFFQPSWSVICLVDIDAGIHIEDSF